MTDKQVLFTEKVRDPSNNNNWLKMRDLAVYPDKGRLKRTTQPNISNYQNEIYFNPNDNDNIFDIVQPSWEETDEYIEYQINEAVPYYMYNNLMYQFDSQIVSINNKLCAIPKETITFQDIKYSNSPMPQVLDIIGIVDEDENNTVLYQINEIEDYDAVAYTTRTISVTKNQKYINNNDNLNPDFQPIANLTIEEYIHGLDTIYNNQIDTWQHSTYVNDSWVIDNNYPIDNNLFTFENNNFRTNCFLVEIYDLDTTITELGNEDNQYYIWLETQNNNTFISKYIAKNSLNSDDYDINNYTSLSLNNLNDKDIYCFNLFHKDINSIENWKLSKNIELTITEEEIDTTNVIESTIISDVLDFQMNQDAADFPIILTSNNVSTNFSIISANSSTYTYTIQYNNINLIYKDINSPYHYFYLRGATLNDDINFLNYWRQTWYSIEDEDIILYDINIEYNKGIIFTIQQKVEDLAEDPQLIQSFNISPWFTIPNIINTYQLINYYDGVIWKNGNFYHKNEINDNIIALDNEDISILKLIQNITDAKSYIIYDNNNNIDITNIPTDTLLDTTDIRLWLFPSNKNNIINSINTLDNYYQYFDADTNNFIRLPIELLEDEWTDIYTDNNLHGYIYGSQISSIYTVRNRHIRYFDGEDKLLNVGSNSRPIYLKNGEFVETDNTDSVFNNISGHILPAKNNIYNIGSDKLTWNKGYINQLNASNIKGTMQLTGSYINITDKQNNNTIFQIGLENKDATTTFSENFDGIANTWHFIPSFSLSQTPKTEEIISIIINDTSYDFIAGYPESQTINISNNPVGILEYNGDIDFNFYAVDDSIINSTTEPFFIINNDEELEDYIIKNIGNIPNILLTNINVTWGYIDAETNEFISIEIPYGDDTQSLYWEWIHQEIEEEEETEEETEEEINAIVLYNTGSWPINDFPANQAIYVKFNILGIEAQSINVNYTLLQNSNLHFTFGTRNANNTSNWQGSTFGEGLTANNNQHVIGKYNIADNDSLFIVGNGTDINNPHNAFKIYNNGNAHLFGDLHLQTNNTKVVFNTIDHSEGSQLNITTYDTNNTNKYRWYFNAYGSLARYQWNGNQWVNSMNVTTNGDYYACLSKQDAHKTLIAPDTAAGQPTWRTLVESDLPSISPSKLNAVVPITKGGTGKTATTTYDLLRQLGLAYTKNDIIMLGNFRLGGFLTSSYTEVYTTIPTGYIIYGTSGIKFRTGSITHKPSTLAGSTSTWSKCSQFQVRVIKQETATNGTIKAVQALYILGTENGPLDLTTSRYKSASINTHGIINICLYNGNAQGSYTNSGSTHKVIGATNNSPAGVAFNNLVIQLT